MFGHNTIVGLKYFKDAPTDQLFVTSRFYTLQGEGPYRGFPAYFVRLTKCNLACSFCDTYFDSGEYQSFDKIFDDASREITAFYAKRNVEVPGWAIDGPKRRIVLIMTGGEPTLQANLAPFLEQAQDHFYAIQIESNGTVGTTITHLPKSTTLVVSPKCLEKKRTVKVPVYEHDPLQMTSTKSVLVGYEDRVEDYAVRYLEPKQEMLDRADCLKFVMSVPDNDRFNPYSEVPGWAHEWALKTDKPIFVSPMNIYRQEPKKAKEMRSARQLTDITIDERSYVDETISFWEEGLLDMKANQLNHEYAADYAMRHGFILNLQIHLYASLP